MTRGDQNARWLLSVKSYLSDLRIRSAVICAVNGRTRRAHAHGPRGRGRRLVVLKSAADGIFAFLRMPPEIGWRNAITTERPAPSNTRTAWGLLGRDLAGHDSGHAKLGRSGRSARKLAGLRSQAAANIRRFSQLTVPRTTGPRTPQQLGWQGCAPLWLEMSGPAPGRRGSSDGRAGCPHRDVTRRSGAGTRPA